MARYGRNLIIAALVLVAGWGVWPRLWAKTGEHKHYLYQARAFLHGRLDIDEPFGDVATFQGKHYVVFPPFPALLITPLVYVLGNEARTTEVSLLLTILNFFLLRGIFRRLEIERELSRWLLAAFFLGSAYTTSLFQAYESWHFAHIVAVTCLLLAIYAALGKRRALLVGLCCGLAFLSRQLTIYPAIFCAALLCWPRRADTPPKRIAALAAFCIPLALCGGAYLYLNWLRFHNPFDTGYSYLPLEGFLAKRVEKYGLFHPAYVPFNLVYMFLQGFHIEFSTPAYLSVKDMDPMGTSVTFASPFLFLAVLAQWRRPIKWAAWLAIVLLIVHSAFYYNNGYAQTNAQRFTLDFLPVLIVLVALGARRVPSIWWKAAIGYSIALNAVALFLVDLLKRLTASL